LTDDCQIVEAHGRHYSKAELLNELPKEEPRLYTPTAFQVKLLNKHIGVVTYTLDVSRSSAESGPTQHLSVNAKWKKIPSAKDERYDWKLMSRQSSFIR